MGKSKRKIINWKQYNQALINRGSVTFWLCDDTNTSWLNDSHQGGRGRTYTFSDKAIQAALAIKGIFNLSLRATQGFIDSIFKLMDAKLRSPGYTCISKRAQTVDVSYRLPAKGETVHLAIDSTGLKVFGEGEWKTKKHGTEKRRTWRKLHLAVDADNHHIVSAEVSLVSIGDAEVLPTLLRPLRRKIGSISADGAYDSKQSYSEVLKKKANPLIPPRSNAALWEDGHPRNEAVKRLKSGEMKEWKVESGYHKRSISETAMFRYKQLINGKLSLRNYNAQVGEALAGVWALNKICGLGMPERKETN